DRFLAALASVVGIEEVSECSSNGSCKGKSRHQSVSLGRERRAAAQTLYRAQRWYKLDPRKIRRISRGSVAPVEVTRASPQAVVGFNGSGLLVIFFAGPLEGDG